MCSRGIEVAPSTVALPRAAVLPGRRLGLVLVLLVLCVTALAQPADASAAARRAAVSRRVSQGTVLPGDTVQVQGRVAHVAPGSRVVLQRARTGSRAWRALRRGHTDAARRYVFRIRPSATYRYRVYAPHQAASHSFVVRVMPCRAARRPARGEATWFSKPGTTDLSQTTRGVTGLLCAAAPRSTVNIAMYFFRTRQQQTTPIVNALQWLVRYRHVKVHILLEGRLVEPGDSLRRSWSDLRRFADVRTCNWGCHNATDVRGAGTLSIMHHKFITVSDTLWRSGRDPAVVFSSANWSQAQLATRWQSTVMVYNDAGLADQVGLQWDELRACSTRSGCAAWAAEVAARRLATVTFGLHFASNVWFIPAAAHPGSAGRGTAVNWSPQQTGDPIATALGAVSCSPQHHTILLDHMFITGARYKVIDQLERLTKAGCTVRFDVSQPADSTRLGVVATLRAAGIDMGCVPVVHDKVVLIDAVRTKSGVPDQEVLMGSQSLGGNALHRNDEALFRLSTASATGSYVAANKAVYNTYVRHWKDMHAHANNCSVQPDRELTKLASELTPDPHDTVAPQ